MVYDIVRSNDVCTGVYVWAKLASPAVAGGGSIVGREGECTADKMGSEIGGTVCRLQWVFP